MIVQQLQYRYSAEVQTIIHFHCVQKINLDFNIEGSREPATKPLSKTSCLHLQKFRRPPFYEDTNR